MDNATRLERLNRLLDVALIHQEHKGIDTPLNGVSRHFNMNRWDCGTSACLMGSYALTEYGKRFFRWDDNTAFREPYLIEDSSEDVCEDAAEHFGIERQDACRLFDPVYYEGPIEPHHAAARVREIIAKYEP